MKYITPLNQPKQPASKCCKAPILWKTLMGIRLYRETSGGKKVYDAQCSKCLMTLEVPR